MEERELSASETMVMKAIWEAEGDISVPDLMEVMRVRYGKDYKRTSIGTFLLRLSDKRFISMYRKGRLSYVHVEKPEEEYRDMLSRKQLNLWFQGKSYQLFAALKDSGQLTKEDREKIREIIDGMDD
ncbi:MAG: penicillinase repressor [Lachnospiraceae bacterium]|nr:penicillinase repressor [Lachnospiraceae bacterium]